MNPRVKLIAHTLSPEFVIALAGKVCYSGTLMSDLVQETKAKDNTEYIEKLKNLGHMSIFEHATFTFAILNISRACSHQLVRHRLASYSQRSQRYIRERHPRWVVPESIVNSKFYPAFMEHLDQLYQCYNTMVDAGIPEEDARYILPNATPTQLVMTMNARELIHFCKIRRCNRAQEEINKLANEIAGCLIAKFPTIFGNGILMPACFPDGQCPEGEMSCGNPPSPLNGEA